MGRLASLCQVLDTLLHPFLFVVLPPRLAKFVPGVHIGEEGGDGLANGDLGRGCWVGSGYVGALMGDGHDWWAELGDA